MVLLSNVYDVTLKKDNRGAAKGGYVRPTISEFFVTNKDFELIQSGYTNAQLWANPVNHGGVSAYVVDADLAIVEVDRSNGIRTSVGMPPNSGKWYFEVELISGNTYFAVGCINNSHTASAWTYNMPVGTVISVIVDTDTGTTSYYRNGSPSTGYSYNQGNTEDVFPYYGIGGQYTTARAQSYFNSNDFKYPEVFAASGAKAYNMVP